MEPWSTPINKGRQSERKDEKKERQTKQRGHCQKINRGHLCQLSKRGQKGSKSVSWPES